MMDNDGRIGRIEQILRESMQRIRAEEQTFRDTVKAGDLVTWEEWVWERGITGNPDDPDTSERVMFTGRVTRVAHEEQGGVLYVDPESVTPTAAEVRQRPRCRLPFEAFRFARVRP